MTPLERIKRLVDNAERAVEREHQDRQEILEDLIFDIRKALADE